LTETNLGQYRHLVSADCSQCRLLTRLSFVQYPVSVTRAIDSAVTTGLFDIVN